jgi:hypothetical protein
MINRDNFYFKYIDIPYDLNEVQAFYKSKPVPSGHFTMRYVDEVLGALPSIKQWFEDNNCKPSRVAYISTLAHFAQPPHKDNSDQILAVNFPVYNCEEIKTLFYDDKNVETKVMYTKAHNIPYHQYMIKGRAPIAEYVLSKPVILNVKKIHSVVNNSNKDRVSLSFRFEEEPWHLIKE